MLYDSTNNHLAIVHAIAHLKKQNSNIPIYSDSRNAIGWVQDKTHRSSLLPTDKNKKLLNCWTGLLNGLKKMSLLIQC